VIVKKLRSRTCKESNQLLWTLGSMYILSNLIQCTLEKFWYRFRLVYTKAKHSPKTFT